MYDTVDKYYDTRRVEEIDSDEYAITDSYDSFNNSALRRKKNKIFFSDSRQFTGIAMEDGHGVRSRWDCNYPKNNNNDVEDSEEDEELAREEVLVKSAISRIQRAQKKGKKDVKLSMDEIKALDQRKKRRKQARNAYWPDRISIPLAELEPSIYQGLSPTTSSYIQQKQPSPPTSVDVPGEQQVFQPAY